MLTALISKAIVGADAVAQETCTKLSIIKEVAVIAHATIKENLPSYKEDLKTKVLDKINKQLSKK